MQRIESHEHVLVVEDTTADFLAIQRAFVKARIANPILHLAHGDEVIDYLFRNGKYVDEETYPSPALILLDLNLPGEDGRSILKKIKSDNQLKIIPVIVLTTSHDQQDIEECYSFGANSYVQKPVTSQGFYEAIQKIEDYWFKLVVLPEPRKHA